LSLKGSLFDALCIMIKCDKDIASRLLE